MSLVYSECPLWDVFCLRFGIEGFLPLEETAGPGLLTQLPPLSRVSDVVISHTLALHNATTDIDMCTRDMSREVAIESLDEDRGVISILTPALR